jgi:hypothetical protein
VVGEGNQLSLAINSLETRMNCGSLFVCGRGGTMEALHLYIVCLGMFVAESVLRKAVAGMMEGRAALDRTAEDGCPHIGILAN